MYINSISNSTTNMPINYPKFKGIHIRRGPVHNVVRLPLNTLKALILTGAFTFGATSCDYGYDTKKIKDGQTSKNIMELYNTSVEVFSDIDSEKVKDSSMVASKRIKGLTEIQVDKVIDAVCNMVKNQPGYVRYRKADGKNYLYFDIDGY